MGIGKLLQLTSEELTGYMLSWFTVIMWTFSTYSVQMLDNYIPDFQLSSYRFVFSIMISVIGIYFRGTRVVVTMSQIPFVLLTCVASLSYNVFYFSATGIIPLAHVCAGFSFSTILIVGLLSKFYLRKDIGWGHGISLVITTLGIVLITQPWTAYGKGFIPKYMKDDIAQRLAHAKNDTYYSVNSMSLNASCIAMSTSEIGLTVAKGYGLLTVAGFTEACNFLLVGIYLQDMDPFVQLFLLCIINIPASILMALYMEEPVAVTSPWTIFFLMIHIGAVGICMPANIAAAQKINPSHVPVIQSFATIVLLIMQYTMMHGNLSGRENALEVIGCVLLTFGIILTPLTGRCRNEYRHEDLESAH